MPAFSGCWHELTEVARRGEYIMGGTVIETESEKLIRKGQIAGEANERCEAVKRMLRKGKTPEEISAFCDYDLTYVREIEESMLQKA
jgi:hypothetical protein